MVTIWNYKRGEYVISNIWKKKTECKFKMDNKKLTRRQIKSLYCKAATITHLLRFEVPAVLVHVTRPHGISYQMTVLFRSLNHYWSKRDKQISAWMHVQKKMEAKNVRWTASLLTQTPGNRGMLNLLRFRIERRCRNRTEQQKVLRRTNLLLSFHMTRTA
jgi:hypothetical protein